jgi:hypothetical protein
MKSPIITDISLSAIEPDLSTDNAERYLAAYLWSIFDIGATYAEINYAVFRALETSRVTIPYGRLIYRINDRSEIPLLRQLFKNENRFSYVCLPESLIDCARDIPYPICLEAYSEPSRFCAKIPTSAFPRITMIRFVGEFMGEFGEYSGYIPVDYCPLNTRLSGVDACVSALKLGHSVTTAFGSVFFTPLEELVVSLMTMYRYLPTNDPIFATCRAQFYAAIFSDIFSQLVEMGMRSVRLETMTRMADGNGDILEKTLGMSGDLFRLGVGIKFHEELAKMSENKKNNSRVIKLALHDNFPFLSGALKIKRESDFLN